MATFRWKSLIRPVPLGSKSQFRELPHDLVDLVLQDRPGPLSLLRKRALEGLVLVHPPAVDPVDLRRGDDKGGLAVPEDLEGLQGLGLEPLVDINDEDRHLCEGPAPGTEGGEGMVAGGIDEEEARDLDIELPQAPAHGPDGIQGDEGRPDVLGDGPFLGIDYRRAPYPVEEGGLAMVHVAEDTDDGCPDACGCGCCHDPAPIVCPR